MFPVPFNTSVFNTCGSVIVGSLVMVLALSINSVNGVTKLLLLGLNFPEFIGLLLLPGVTCGIGGGLYAVLFGCICVLFWFMMFSFDGAVIVKVNSVVVNKSVVDSA